MVRLNSGRSSSSNSSQGGDGGGGRGPVLVVVVRVRRGLVALHAARFVRNALLGNEGIELQLVVLSAARFAQIGQGEDGRGVDEREGEQHGQHGCVACVQYQRCCSQFASIRCCLGNGARRLVVESRGAVHGVAIGGVGE